MPAYVSNSGIIQFAGANGTATWVSMWNQDSAGIFQFRGELTTGQATPLQFAIGMYRLKENDGQFNPNNSVAALTTRIATTMYIQLHTDDPGVAGTLNVISGGRQAVAWGTVTTVAP